MSMTKMGNDYCPCCKALLDAASPAEGNKVPMPGDITICFYCAEVLMFSDDMELIKCPEVIIETLSEETQVQIFIVTETIKEKIARQN